MLLEWCGGRWPLWGPVPKHGFEPCAFRRLNRKEAYSIDGQMLTVGCVRVQPHAALGVYGPTVHVMGRTVCHAMDGPSHAFANPVNVDIRRDFPRVFLSGWIGEVWSHDGVAGRHGKNHLLFRRSQLHIFDGNQRECIGAELGNDDIRILGEGRAIPKSHCGTSIRSSHAPFIVPILE